MYVRSSCREMSPEGGNWFFWALMRTHPQLVTDLTKAREIRMPASWNLDTTSRMLRWRTRPCCTAS